MSDLEKVVSNNDLVEALRNVGVTPEWVKALFDQPQLLRSYVGGIKKQASLRLFHPDSGGSEELQQLAGIFNAACDLIASEKVSDEALVTAMKTYYTQASSSRLEVLSELQSAIGQNEELTRRLTIAEETVMRAKQAEAASAVHDCQLKIDTSIEAWRSRAKRGTAGGKDGKTVHLFELAGKYIFSSPSVTELDPSRVKEGKELLATVDYLEVDDRGYADKIPISMQLPLGTSESAAKAQVLKKGIDRIRQKVKEVRDPLGLAIGFVHDEVIKGIKDGTFTAPFDTYMPTREETMECDRFITACNLVLQTSARLPNRSVKTVSHMVRTDYGHALVIVNTSEKMGERNGTNVTYVTVPIALVLDRKEVSNMAFV